jgi:hypothetical protein
VAFTISDVDNSVDSLTLSALTDRPDLLPDSSFVFGGSGTNRTLTVTAAAESSDTANVTIKVTDPAGASRSTGFLVTFSIDSAGQFTAIPTDSGVQITLAVVPGRFYVIESSTDLQTWTELQTVTTASGLVAIDAQYNGSETARFYRARVK